MKKPKRSLDYIFTVNFYRKLGEKLRLHRELVGLTQEAVAIEVCISRGSVANIELGRQHPPLHTFLKMARTVGMPIEPLKRLLFTEQNKRKP